MAKIKEVRKIPLNKLKIGMGQVRLRNIDKEIDELTNSIRKVGLLEPIVVCEHENEGMYEIITGQRRFLAYQRLGESTILAGVLDKRVDETTAKVLSVTENLVRRDLDSIDLIEVCTYLYKRYGSIKAVIEETGLPNSKVYDYVKYDQLSDELKELVDKNKVKLQAALRAQKAATVSGETNNNEAVELAIEMNPMSGAQQSKIIKDREKNPLLSVDELIENAKSGGRITQISVTLSSQTHQSLSSFANSEGTNIDDAARILIQDGLDSKGY